MDTGENGGWESTPETIFQTLEPIGNKFSIGRGMQGKQSFDGSLPKVLSVSITCDDCGRTRRMFREGIVVLQGRGLQTISDMYRSMHCSYCRSFGGLGDNFIIKPVLVGRCH